MTTFLEIVLRFLLLASFLYAAGGVAKYAGAQRHIAVRIVGYSLALAIAMAGTFLAISQFGGF